MAKAPPKLSKPVISACRKTLNKHAKRFDLRYSEGRAAFCNIVDCYTFGAHVITIRELAKAFGCEQPRTTRAQAVHDLANCWIAKAKPASEHYARSPVKQNPKKKGVEAALAAVPEDVRNAALDVHGRLQSQGIPHMLVGGLAVGARGYPRSTKDADFMVTDDAFRLTSKGLVLGMNHDLPYEVGKIGIDYLSPRSAGESAALERTRGASKLRAAPVEVLVRMKLKIGRARDEGDVVEMLKAGASRKKIRSFLWRDAPELMEKFNALCLKADQEAP